MKLVEKKRHLKHLNHLRVQRVRWNTQIKELIDAQKTIKERITDLIEIAETKLLEASVCPRCSYSGPLRDTLTREINRRYVELGDNEGIRWECKDCGFTRFISLDEAAIQGVEV